MTEICGIDLQCEGGSTTLPSFSSSHFCSNRLWWLIWCVFFSSGKSPFVSRPQACLVVRCWLPSRASLSKARISLSTAQLSPFLFCFILPERLSIKEHIMSQPRRSARFRGEPAECQGVDDHNVPVVDVTDVDDVQCFVCGLTDGIVHQFPCCGQEAHRECAIQ